MIYNLIGRVVVKFGRYWLRRRLVLRTVVLTGVGVTAGAFAIGLVGYLLTRGDVPEA